ncbi:MAG: hypothetical protein JSS58_07075, partial [Proteobacteria bacterium]|nr:hypothetical protein [Pseudomonadota bacterium]
MATAPKAVPKAPAGKASAQEAPPPPAPKKSGKKTMLIVIVLVLLLAGGGGAAWFFMNQGGDAPAGEGEAGATKATHKKKEPPKAPVFMVVEPFTVNLQPDESGGDRYLQVAFSLQ